MFAIIEVNGATHIAIHIPHQGSEKSLPALAAVLEQNAVFIKQGYQEMSTVKPVMSILLGDTYRFEQYGVEAVLAIPESSTVLDDSFALASPLLFTSNAKAIQREKDDNAKIRTELQYVKQQLEGSKARVEQLETQFASELAPL